MEHSWASPVAQLVKKSTCYAGNLGFIPVLGRSLEKGMATHSSILAWSIPGLYGPWGCKELDMTERLSLSFYSSMSLNFKYMNCSFNIYFNVFANFDSCVCSSSVLAD